MLIVSAPIVLPVTTANIPTEAVAAEAAQKPPIPEATSATENTNLKNGTDSNEQKNAITDNRSTKGKESRQEENTEQQEQQGNNSQEQRQQALETQQIDKLKRRDREVRAHEAAHANAGGQYAGAPQLSFKIGPDGKRYAVAGEVSINTSKVADNPQATIDKMAQVRRAALAPASPSAQDFKVAAIASQIANQALTELNLEQREAQAQQVSGDESVQSQDDEESQTQTQRLQSDRKSTSPETPVANRLQLKLSLNQKIESSGAYTDVNINRQLSIDA
ncbi:putative metalloprotease CJM1_0395 family protein [Aliikangiella maris]|uniref:Metalloprotease CJM1_0395 family protein n=2 Tax=Aliikangiella maris TaxID=3162458 RepID=A0ABV2BYA5_9GAMM